MAQPDVQRVTDHLKGITAECEKISNIPAVDGGRNLAAIMTDMRNEMRQMAQQMNDNTNRMRQMEQQMNDNNTNMRNDIAALRTDFTDHLNANDANASARLINSTVKDADVHLESLRDSHNQPLANFPEDYDAILRMTVPEVTNILQQYNLPTNGNVTEKRKRLARFAGMRGAMSWFSYKGSLEAGGT